MYNEIKTFYKLFTAWQDDREEEWLRQMARKGWHLLLPRLGSYTFRRGEPQDVVYRLDYFSSWSKDEKEAYYQLFAEAGWEFTGELVGWQYFRKPARPGELDEIYTDNASKIAKHRRLMAVFATILLAMFANMINILLLPYGEDFYWYIFMVIFAAVLLLLSYALLRTWLRIRALKKLV